MKVRDWLGEHPDNVIVVHCKVILVFESFFRVQIMFTILIVDSSGWERQIQIQIHNLYL